MPLWAGDGVARVCMVWGLLGEDAHSKAHRRARGLNSGAVGVACGGREGLKVCQ